MASYTEHLNLLKKNPATDGADTFNIETMLNENWDKIDEAVAKKAELGADGKIPPEQLPEMNYDKAGSAEAVQKNLDAHTGNRSNPHGVTAEQIQTSGGKSVEAALSDKVSNTWEDRVQIPDGSNIEEFLVGKPYGYYYVFGGDFVEGMPTAEQDWWFVEYAPSGVYAIRSNSNKLWFSEFTNNTMIGWQRIVNEGDLANYLPLAGGALSGNITLLNGFTMNGGHGSLNMWNTQELILSVTNSDGTDQRYISLATSDFSKFEDCLRIVKVVNAQYTIGIVYNTMNVQKGTADIGAGSGLANDHIYLCYE